MSAGRNAPIRRRWFLFGLELTALWLVVALFEQRQAIGLAFDPMACSLGDPSIPARGLVLLGMASTLDCQALLHIALYRAVGLTVFVPVIAWLLVPAALAMGRRLLAEFR